MKKLPIITLLIAFLSVFSSGQEQELDKHFKKVEVVKLDTKDILKKVSEGKLVKIGKFDLKLEYSEIRSKDFQSKETTRSGTVIVEPVKINTVKGVVINGNNSHVRMTIDDDLEGYIKDSGEAFYLERADKYDKKLSTDSFVLYKHQDKKQDNTFVCGVGDAVKEKEQGIRAQALTMTATSMQPGKVLRLLTDADTEYFVANGSSPDATNKRILSILNMVQGMYSVELDIDIQVVVQHVWTTANPDSYAQPGVGNKEGIKTLEDFKNYWNSIYAPPTVQRDHAHLFTNKNFVADNGGTYGGWTYVGKICQTDEAYGWTKYSGNDFDRRNGALHESTITAHEIGHVLGEDAGHPVDNTQQKCTNRGGDPVGTLPENKLQIESPFFCQITKDQFWTTLAQRPSCLLRTSQSPPAPVKQSFDFDGDGKALIASFSPAAFAKWYVRDADEYTSDYQYGTTGDIPVAADYDGDRRTDLAVFRPQYTSTQAAFFLRRSTLDRIAIYFGAPGDIPVQGDYDADERTDVAVFRPSNGVWYIQNVFNGQVTSFGFGISGDIPVQADYDGDGKTDAAVFRPSNGTWYIRKSSGGFYEESFGLSTDKFVPADYDGDRKMDIAVWRPSNGVWYIQRSSQGYTSIPFGSSNDTPVVGDYDGDGRADQAVKIYGTRETRILLSLTGQTRTDTLDRGNPTDIPIGFRNPQ